MRCELGATYNLVAHNGRILCWPWPSIREDVTIRAANLCNEKVGRDQKHLLASLAMEASSSPTQSSLTSTMRDLDNNIKLSKLLWNIYRLVTLQTKRQVEMIDTETPSATAEGERDLRLPSSPDSSTHTQSWSSRTPFHRPRSWLRSQ
jgi:hypothetical protein